MLQYLISCKLVKFSKHKKYNAIKQLRSEQLVLQMKKERFKGAYPNDVFDDCTVNCLK